MREETCRTKRERFAVEPRVDRRRPLATAAATCGGVVRASNERGGAVSSHDDCRRFPPTRARNQENKNIQRACSATSPGLPPPSTLAGKEYEEGVISISATAAAASGPAVTDSQPAAISWEGGRRKSKNRRHQTMAAVTARDDECIARRRARALNRARWKPATASLEDGASLRAQLAETSARFLSALYSQRPPIQRGSGATSKKRTPRGRRHWDRRACQPKTLYDETESNNYTAAEEILEGRKARVRKQKEKR